MRHGREIAADPARYSTEAKRQGLVVTPGFVIGRQRVSRAPAASAEIRCGLFGQVVTGGLAFPPLS
jgi:hypothetical protein